MIDKIRSRNKRYVSDKVAYTLILRVRTLYIIRKLIENKDYSTRDFIKIVNTISGGTNAYESYLSVKNGIKNKNKNSIDEIEKLYEYLKNELFKVKKLLKSR